MLRKHHSMLVLNPHDKTGPTLRRKDSTTHYRKGRHGPDSIGVEKLVLLLTWGGNSTDPDWLNQLLPRPTYTALIRPTSTTILSMIVLSVWRDRLQDLHNCGKGRISGKRFCKGPVLIVYQKSEALNKTYNSLQQTFASNLIEDTLWHTAASNESKINEEVLERWESWRSKVSFVVCLFCF